MNDSLDKRIRHRNAVARAHSQASRGQTSTLMVKEGPVYTGRAREIFPIALVNIVLTFLTVGIYRFWAKTRIRRYFVSRVSFLGDPLEYSGTGMELFIGFLIIMAVLVPLFMVMGILQGFFMRPGTDLVSSGIFELGYLLAIYFLYNVAVYRAQRYRLSRINWRGIRGGQEGSALLYATLAIGLGVATLLTVGLIYPIMRRVLVGYRINRSCFGAERFHFSGGAAKLFAAWLVPWALVTGVLGAIAYLAATMGVTVDEKNAEPDQIADLFSFIWQVYGEFLPLPAVAILLAFIWYRAVETRQWMNGTAFDQLAFASRLNLFHILLPYLAYLALLAVVSGAVFYGIAQAIDLTGPRTAPALPAEAPILIAIAAVAVLWIIGGLLQPVIVQNWLISNICHTLSIQGRFSPDTLFQNQLDIPRSGEGLADALDVDAF